MPPEDAGREKRRPFMDLGDLIKPEQVIPALRVKSKKQMLQELSQQTGHFRR